MPALCSPRDTFACTLHTQTWVFECGSSDWIPMSPDNIVGAFTSLNFLLQNKWAILGTSINCNVISRTFFPCMALKVKSLLSVVLPAHHWGLFLVISCLTQSDNYTSESDTYVQDLIQLSDKIRHKHVHFVKWILLKTKSLKETFFSLSSP